MFGTISFAEPILHSIVIYAPQVRLALLPGPWMACAQGLATPSAPHLPLSTITDTDRKGTQPSHIRLPQALPKDAGRDVLSSGPMLHRPERSDGAED